jgi:hypothetical protein
MLIVGHINIFSFEQPTTVTLITVLPQGLSHVSNSFESYFAVILPKVLYVGNACNSFEQYIVLALLAQIPTVKRMGTSSSRSYVAVLAQCEDLDMGQMGGGLLNGRRGKRKGPRNMDPMLK